MFYLGMFLGFIVGFLTVLAIRFFRKNKLTLQIEKKIFSNHITPATAWPRI